MCFSVPLLSGIYLDLLTLPKGRRLRASTGRNKQILRLLWVPPYGNVAPFLNNVLQKLPCSLVATDCSSLQRCLHLFRWFPMDSRGRVSPPQLLLLLDLGPCENLSSPGQSVMMHSTGFYLPSRARRESGTCNSIQLVTSCPWSQGEQCAEKPSTIISNLTNGELELFRVRVPDARSRCSGTSVSGHLPSACDPPVACMRWLPLHSRGTR